MATENRFLNQTFKGALNEMRDLAQSGNDDAIDELGRNINKMVYALRGVSDSTLRPTITKDQQYRVVEWLRDNIECAQQALAMAERSAGRPA